MTNRRAGAWGWLALVAWFICSPAVAVQIETAGITECRVAGYLKDPRGTNVRSAPRTNAPTVGRLPSRMRLEPGSDVFIGAEFDIVGAKNGWLLIRNARIGADAKQMFKGSGWISGRLVGVTLGADALRAAPDREAPPIAKLSGELKDGTAYGPDSYLMQAVHDCDGHFTEIAVVPARFLKQGDRPIRGWVERVCSTQLTTCDPSFTPTPFDLPRGEADARAACIAGLADMLAGEACKVTDFGEIGTVEDHTFVYALYATATKDNVVVNTRAAIFERRPDGQLRLRRAADADGSRFGKPTILRTRAGVLLHILGSESGTGNINREALYVWRAGRWKIVDTKSWLATLQRRLPAGRGAWKGIYPDYTTLKARTPLWRKGDSNACATGGTADLALAWSGDAIVLSGVKVHRRSKDCNE